MSATVEEGIASILFGVGSRPGEIIPRHLSPTTAVGLPQGEPDHSRPEREGWVQHADLDTGVAFRYPGRPDGYVLTMSPPHDGESEVVTRFVLTLAVDAEEMSRVPPPGEGPPTITVTVVATHGGHAYVVAGAYLESGSPIRRDFEPFLRAIRFIPMRARSLGDGVHSGFADAPMP